MSRIYNFSAGPAILPEPVLREAADEMLEYGDSSVSVMEMSHRSATFETLLRACEADLRALMDIPDNYAVLFLQGGASLQFAMAPMNLMRNGKADYLVTGSWSKKAADEAGRFGDVFIPVDGKSQQYTAIPDLDEAVIRDDADYVFICENETIYGCQYPALPRVKGKDIVADLSSCICSEPIDVSRYALIFAGAQKNLGPAGVTIVILRKDLIRDDLHSDVPTLLNYKTYHDNQSLYNTPPAYAIYICGKVLRWLREEGGLPEMQRRNQAKAELLYDYLDKSRLFSATVVNPSFRSLMNVPFVSGNPDLDTAFLKLAKSNGLHELKGHRSVGGMRASIYNAMPIEGIEALISCMRRFEDGERI